VIRRGGVAGTVLCAVLSALGYGILPLAVSKATQNLAKEPQTPKEPACCRNLVVILHGFDMPNDLAMAIGSSPE